MRYEHLERIKVDLNVLSPVHIGCGEKLRKKEQIFDEERGMLHVPAMPEMLEYIVNNCPQGILESYERFLQQDTTDDLGTFLKSKNIRLSPMPRWIHRSIRVGGNIRRVNELSLFMHNMQEEAYIPGSSIKGALRTALIAHYMDRESIQRDFRGWKAKSGAVESTLRRLKADERRSDDAVNDLLRGLEITDTAVFAREDMTVCQRTGMCTNTSQTQQPKLPTFSECLRPSAKTHFYMTLDYNILPKDFIQMLKKSLTEWDEIQHMAYDRFFENNGVYLADTVCRRGVPLILGSGTGFQTHSMVYAAFRDSDEGLNIAEDILMKQFSKTYKPSRDAEAAPYQKKITQYDGQNYPMGRCELLI